MALRDIDKIIEALESRHPRLIVEQIKASHPADDDGVWCFSHPELPYEVQLESASGSFPFLVETDRHDQRAQAGTLDEAIQLVDLWLGL